MHKLSIARTLLLLCIALLPHTAHAFFGGVTAPDTTWTGIVMVDGDVVVEPQAMLTIAAGTKVIFTPGRSLFDDPKGLGGLCDIIVKGRLRVLGGTGADSVYFTSGASRPAPGDWGYVRFDTTSVDDSCVVQNAVFRYARRSINITSAGPTITNSTFDFAYDAGIDGSGVDSLCHISGIKMSSNQTYGLRFTDFRGSVLRSTFSGARIVEVLLTRGNGRFAQNVIANDRVTNSVGLQVDDSDAIVALDTLRNNLTAMLVSGGSHAAIESCLVTSNTIGLQVSGASPSVSSCDFTNNNVAIDCLQGGLPTVGDSLLAANDFLRNGVTIRNVKGNTSFIRAHYNYWGTTVEDSIFAHTVYGVDVSPWTDSLHVAQIQAASYGVITTDRTWSGVVTVRGDIVVPDSVSLIVNAGTVIRMQAGFANWDTVGVNIGLCDIDVFGLLTVSGTPTDTVRFTSAAASPAPGDWGVVYFGPMGSGSVVGALSEYGVDGFTFFGRPSINGCRARFALHSGFHAEQGGSPTIVSSVAERNENGFYLLNGGSPTIQNCTIQNNSVYGIYSYNLAPTIDNNVITGNSTGVNLIASGPEMRGNVITSNAQYGIFGDHASGATIGALGAPNLIYGNGGANICNYSNDAIIHAPYNYWGAESEDSVAQGILGSVDYSPYYNNARTVTLSAASYGQLTSDTAWLGTRYVRGDIVVPKGVTLTVGAGARVRVWSQRTAYDDPNGVPARADIVVYGRLVAQGTQAQPVAITSEAALPSAGDWGRVILLPASSDSSNVSYATITAWSGLSVNGTSPTFLNDSLAAAVDTTFRALNTAFYAANMQVGVPAGGVGFWGGGVSPSLANCTLSGAGRTAIALDAGSSPVLDGLLIAGADTAASVRGASAPYLARTTITSSLVGVRLTGGAATLQSVFVSNRGLGILCDGGTTATLRGCRITSVVPGTTGLEVDGGSTPRVDSLVVDNAGFGSSPAYGVKVTGTGSRPDLGGGRRGSRGGNVLKGFAGSGQYAIYMMAAVTDTVYALNTFWGTADTTVVDAMIYDHADDPNVGYVQYHPVLRMDVPAVFWSATSSRTEGVTLFWRGEPGTLVEVWRAPIAGERTPVWTSDYAYVGSVVVDRAGLASYVDAAARRDVGYVYVLAIQRDGLLEPVADVRVEAQPARLALGTVQRRRGRSAMPEIVLELPAPADVTLAVFDLAGRRVAALDAGARDAGRHLLAWPLRSHDVTPLPSGVYFLRAHTTLGDVTTRCVLTR
jgi:parallel beta-helix repeat protein